MAELDLARARELFDAIVELPAIERTAALHALCDDAAMRDYVLRLVAADDVHTGSGIARQIDAAYAAASGPEVAVGEQLGPWRLVAELGRGGMGAVFLAERQDGLYEQRAALKVLQGVASAEAIRLLASERQMLAKLTHPNIARLLDGGTTPLGRPYLVMDYVDGVALDVHAATLTLRQRLRLFLQICETVTFAHAQLIVHCDLKPSNILIDARGRVVLLDFGIARLVDRAESQGPNAGASPHTPRYASPELREGSRVGTAADIYALGVILGDLIEASPPRDLLAIAARASATQEAERYPTVPALIGEIERYLDHRPVQARAGRWWYRFGLLLQRRWPALLIAAAFVATATGFTVQLIAQRDRALAAEANAQREADTARATSTFLQEVFRGADLEEGGGRETTALSLVDRGRDRVRGELAAQPAIQIAMFDVLADVYASLGEPIQAEALRDEAIAVARKLQPARTDELASLLIDRAVLLTERNRHAEAEAPAREALALAGAGGSSAEPSRLQVDALSALATVEIGLQHYDAAATALNQALAQREALHDPPAELARTWYEIALNLRESGDNAGARAGFERARAAFSAALGDDHPRTLDAAQALGVSYGRLERLTEAERILRDVLARRLKLHGERGSQVADVQSELAYVMMQQGRYVDGAAFTEQVLAHDAAVQGEQSPVYARTLNNLAFAYMNMGDAERAIAAFSRSIDIRIATLPPGDLGIARAQNNLARLLITLNRLEAAKPLVDAALKSRSEQLPADNEERVESQLSAMEWARRSGDLATATGYWNAVQPVLAKVHPYTQLEAARAHAWLAVSSRQPEAPALINAYIDGLRKALGDSNPAILRGQVAQAEMLLALGDKPAAHALGLDLKQRFQAMPKAYPAQSFFHPRVQAVIDASAGP